MSAATGLGGCALSKPWGASCVVSCDTTVARGVEAAEWVVRLGGDGHCEMRLRALERSGSRADRVKLWSLLL